MNIKDALLYISKKKYYEICGYKYNTLEHGNHQDLSFNELPFNMQMGVINLTINLYQIQKMVYSYDIDYLNQCLIKSGIKLKPFYEDCGLNKTFHRTLNISFRRNEKNKKIKIGLIRMINRLLIYQIQ